MTGDLDAFHTNDRVPRTISQTRVPWVNLSIIDLEQTCPNHTHITVASSVV